MADHNERWVLNHLIELCRDEELTLRYAVEHVKDPSVKGLFMELAAQRAQFAAELLPHAQRLGGAEPAETTARGTLRRGWLAIRDTLVGSNDTQIISEAEHAESLAQSTYQHALDEMLPPTARDLVEQQWNEIRRAHERVRAFLTH
jgi:uncharacterized protein (TIGR02284 family)